MCIKTNNKHLLNFSFGLILFLMLSIFSCEEFERSGGLQVDIGNLGFYYSNSIVTTEGTPYTSLPATWNTSPMTAHINYRITRRPENASDTAVSINTSTGAVTVSSSATESDSGHYEITASVVNANDKNYKGTNSKNIEVRVLRERIDLATLTFNNYAELNVFVGDEESSLAASWTGENAIDISDGTQVTYEITSGPGTWFFDIRINSYTGVVTIQTSARKANSGTYTITAYAREAGVYSETNTANITINVIEVDLATLTFNDYAELNVPFRNTGRSSAPSWSGENASFTSDWGNVWYSISTKPRGALDSDVVINSITGEITVYTSANEANSGTYTIAAYPKEWHTGTNTANITINIIKTDLATLTFNDYADINVTIGDGGTSSVASWFEDAVSTNDGSDVTYAISRPGGGKPVAINIDSTTGQITVGENSIVEDSGIYTITAKANTSSKYTGTQTSNININIKKIDLTTLTFNDYPGLGMFVGNGSLSTYASWSGENAVSTNDGRDVLYAISRPGGVPETIIIHPDTGQITVGENSIVEDSGTYTITANPVSNSDYIGSQTASLVVGVFTARPNTGEYYKLADNKIPLGIQTGTWSQIGTNGAGTNWNCVMDSSGRVWEIKARTRGVRNWLLALTLSEDAPPDRKWDDLVNEANANTGICGYTDWRVPNHEELSSLIIESDVTPKINTGVFPNTLGAQYWTSELTDPNTARVIDFEFGDVNSTAPTNEFHYIRLVRSN